MFRHIIKFFAVILLGILGGILWTSLFPRTHLWQNAQDKNLPMQIFVSDVPNFDIKEYIGCYNLVTQENNARYYVHNNGCYRFPAKTTRSRKICSAPYRKFFEIYQFASELESKSGNHYVKQDEFIFCQNASIQSATKLGTKFTIHRDGTVDWANVSLVPIMPESNPIPQHNYNQESDPIPQHNYNQESDPIPQHDDDDVFLRTLPQTITIFDVRGFDCKEYTGNYSLILQGPNKGYYLHQSGKHRFNVHFKLSKDIVSSSYHTMIRTYMYASEMETGRNNSFHGRDDYIFLRTNDILWNIQNNKAKLGTKFTIHRDGTADWALVRPRASSQSAFSQQK